MCVVSAWVCWYSLLLFTLYTLSQRIHNWASTEYKQKPNWVGKLVPWSWQILLVSLVEIWIISQVNWKCGLLTAGNVTNNTARYVTNNSTEMQQKAVLFFLTALHWSQKGFPSTWKWLYIGYCLEYQWCLISFTVISLNAWSLTWKYLTGVWFNVCASMLLWNINC